MDEPCTGCGWVAAGGTAGCQARVEELWARDFGDVRYFRVHRMAVDAYALQHAERYCASAKSLAAHLGGLCCAFEHGDDASALPALQRWLNGTVPLEKPEPLPSFRGALTIGDLEGAEAPAAYAQAVERWARATWGAYEALQPLARMWIGQALSVPAAPRPRSGNR